MLIQAKILKRMSLKRCMKCCPCTKLDLNTTSNSCYTGLTNKLGNEHTCTWILLKSEVYIYFIKCFDFDMYVYEHTHTWVTVIVVVKMHIWGCQGDNIEIMAFWVMIPCSLVNRCSFWKNFENGGTAFLRNVGTSQTKHLVLHPRGL